MDININLSNNECIDVVIHMCKKMGIHVKMEILFSPFPVEYSMMHGKAIDFEIEPMLSYETPWLICNRMRADKFVWKHNETDIVLQALCLGITGFKIRELNVVVTNPFFKAKDILNAKSKEEAIIQADLWFPGDNTKQVHAYVVEKDIERLMNGKTRYVA